MDKSLEGILGVMFSYRTSVYEFLVFSCYLATENSTRGHDAQNFFAQTVYSQNVYIYLMYDFYER